jgi:AraC-like DNA-binding protein
MLALTCSDQRMRVAIEFLFSQDLRREFRTEQLSQHLNLSTSRLLHLFHEHLGASPSQILKLRRLREAKRLLESTFLSVKEVMAAVGFNDLSHFVRDFKEMYGHSPSEFRKQSRNESVALKPRKFFIS